MKCSSLNMKKFYDAAIEELFDFSKVVIQIPRGNNQFYLATSWDTGGMSLSNISTGAFAVKIDANYMDEWEVLSLRRRIPVGDVTKIVCLEVT